MPLKSLFIKNVMYKLPRTFDLYFFLEIYIPEINALKFGIRDSWIRDPRRIRDKKSTIKNYVSLYTMISPIFLNFKRVKLNCANKYERIMKLLIIIH